MLPYKQVERGSRCFACDHVLGKALVVVTIDGQTVYVGPDCYAHVIHAGPEGYQPPLGGPRLVPLTSGRGTE